MPRFAGTTLVLVLVMALAAEPVLAQGAPPKKVAASIARLFGPEALADTVQVDGSPVLRIRTGLATEGFAVVRNVLGKDQPITFLVATDTAGALKDVDILVYEAWRKQFRGKTASDPLVIGRDVRSISGATISANSVTQGIRVALTDLARWKSEGRLH
jgi:hypothetical protein